jgi:outer membrane protein assembly factor BamB
MTSAKLLIVLLTLLSAGAPPAEARVDPPADPVAPGPRLREAWEAALGPARGTTLKNCVSVGERLLVSDWDGGVTALDPRTGALQWFVQTPSAVQFRPSDGGAIALASGPAVIAVDGATGHRLLEIATASAPGASPCSDGELLFVPSLLDDTLVAWDIDTGTKAWEFRMPAPFTGVSLVVGTEGSRSVVVATTDGRLRAIPAQREVPRGERWVQRVGRVIGAPVLDGNRLLVASADRTLLALDVASGNVAWKQFPGETPRFAPVVAGGQVAVLTGAGVLVLDAETGVLAWDLPGGGMPVGEVGGELLLRREGGTCEWREAATGRLLAEHLPGMAVACGGRLIELRDGERVVAGERAER